MWSRRRGQRQCRRLAKISAGQSAGCTTKSQINYACSVPQQQQQQHKQHPQLFSLLFFFCGLSTTGNRTPTRPTPTTSIPPPPLPLLTFWKTIKAIKKSLYKLAALAVYFFFVPVALWHWTLYVDQWRRFACSANACVAAQSETARLYVRRSGAYLLSSRWATRRRRRRCRRRLCSLSIDSAVDFGFCFCFFLYFALFNCSFRCANCGYVLRCCCYCLCC